MFHLLILILFVGIWRFVFAKAWDCFFRELLTMLIMPFWRCCLQNVCLYIWNHLGKFLIFGGSFLISYPVYVTAHVLCRLFSYSGEFQSYKHASEFSDELVSILSQEDFYTNNFFENLFIGLSIAIALLFVQNSSWLTSIQDEDMDMVMEIHENSSIPKGRILGNEEKEIPPFVFLDIDDKTYAGWEEQPPFTPRNRLLNLIKVAVSGNAKIVIVDVDLSTRTPVDKEKGLHRNDQDLSDFLAKYTTECKKGGDAIKNYPPIILSSSFLPSEDTEEKSSKPLELSPSFLDKVVTKESSPCVQWASARFIAREHIIRHWELWHPVCDGEQPDVVPSIELLAASMICNDDATNVQRGSKGSQKVADTLASFKPRNCGNETDKHPQELVKDNSLPPEKTFCICENNSKLKVSGTQGISQRIMYNIPWLPSEGRENLVESRPPIVDKNGRDILRVLSAKNFSEPSVAELSDSFIEPSLPFIAKLHRNDLKDRVVIIGGSYTFGGDMHKTPIGEMPGGLIVVNAINSLLEYGEFSTSFVLNILLIVLSILVMSIVLEYHHPFDGMVILGTLLLIISVPVAIQLLGAYSLWLDFALPLVIVHYHLLVVEAGGKSHKQKNRKTSKRHTGFDAQDSENGFQGRIISRSS